MQNGFFSINRRLIKRQIAALSYGLTLSLFSLPSFATTPTGPSQTAMLSGDFFVSGGQAGYTLPISVAPGRGGHQPQLSIEYRSDSPNGVMGMGWSIGGLSSIGRCGKNIATDGAWGGVNFNENDRFCLDGQRLIAVSGKDGDNLTEYRLKDNGYSKIVSFGTSGSGPEYFKVWRKDGSLYEYGNTVDSRAELPGSESVLRWAVNKIATKANQNSIDFTYHEDLATSSHRINEINYVGGKVVFNYADRPDKTSQYRSGALLKRSQRISAISTFAADGTTDTGQYNFSYAQSSATQRTLLQSIEYCVDKNCTTKSEFDWSSRAASEYANQNITFYSPRFMDRNRDGTSEVYGILNQYQKEDHRMSDTKQVYTLRNPDGSTVVDSKGKYTLVGSESNPRIQTTTWKIIRHRTRNSDDRNDRDYRWDTTPDSVCMDGSYKPAGKDNLVAYCGNKAAGDFNGDGKETLISKNNQQSTQVTDLNGDGLDDIIYIYPSDNRYIKFKLSGIHSSFKTLHAFNTKGNTNQFQLADVNNDGNLDIFTRSFGTLMQNGVNRRFYDGSGAGNIYLFDGNHFTARQQRFGGVTGNSQFVDMNNDGYPELFRAGKFYRNNFGTVTDEVLLSYDSATTWNSISFRDLNGDGWSDFTVNNRRSTGSIGTSKLRRSTAAVQDKIIKFREFGVEYSIDYTAAVDSGVHTQQPHYAWPIVSSTPRRYLVEKTTKSPLGYQPTETTYHYEGAKSHRKGHGFLGYKTITSIQKSEVETKTVTEFLQGETNIELAGKRKSVIVTKNSLKVSEKQFDYKHLEFQGQGAKYHQVYANKITSKTFDINPDSLAKVEKQEVVDVIKDRFGNTTKTVKNISSDFAGAGAFKVEQTSEYIASWLNKNYEVLHLNSVVNIVDIEQRLASYKTKLIGHCAADGSIYFKPADLIVLIHGEVDVPIIAERYNDYYKYNKASYTEGFDGLISYRGTLRSVTESVFNNIETKECGSYSISDFDGDGKVEFSSAPSTQSELATETGDNFWKISAPKFSTETITDLSNNLIRSVSNTFSYDTKGQLTQSDTQSSQYEAGDSAYGRVDKSVINRYRYDQYGNVISTAVSGTDLAERQSTTQYDLSNGLFPISETNALGHKTQFTHDGKTGQIAESISATKGRKTSWNYDEFGRLAQQTAPGINNITSVSYKLGQHCANATTQTAYCSITSATQRGQTVVHYDYAGREIRNLHQAFNGEWVVRDTSWDRSGRKVASTRPSFLKKLKSTQATVTFTYDALSRVRTKTEPAAEGGDAVFTTRYSGLETTLEDARGFLHSTHQNVLGHISKKVEPHGAYQDYTYYPDGKLKTTTDSQGNVTSIRYDNLGHRTHLDDPDMGKWRYNYNILGELVTKQDANGVKTTLTYDLLGRKVSETSGSQVSTWRYDERGAIGTLSSFEGNGSRTDYYYNQSGLLEESAMVVNGEKFSTLYRYDEIERLEREVRPNGVDQTNLSNAINLDFNKLTQDRLAVDYFYNDLGYLEKVGSPKTYADEVFTSASFREEITLLIKEATEQAKQYLAKAEEYATQKTFYADKAAEYQAKTVNVHQLEASSAALLQGANRYKQWCNAQGECYLRPATWVMLHDEVTIPLDVTLDGTIFRIESQIASSVPGERTYTTVLHPINESGFLGQPLTKAHDFLLTDYHKDGGLDLVSSEDIYVAKADSTTQQQLLYTADDLVKASEISASRYQYYIELADQLLSLVEKVADLSGLYCESANQLAGGSTANVDFAGKAGCGKSDGVSQTDHLEQIHKNSEDAKAGEQQYIYYWQRRDTDAYDHTLAETLGNGLVNTYVHNQNTGRPEYITTHKSSQVFNSQLKSATNSGRNIRLIEYRYDDHNNVTMRYDLELGIKDRYEYDGLDRVIKNSIELDSATRHTVGNPDLNGPFTFSYDTLGNIKSKTGIGSYSYNKVNAGPHAVTQANGLDFNYDKVGNLTHATGEAGAVERTIGWNYYNKPVSIERNNNRVEFKYDANHSRYLKTSSDGKETIYVSNKYERTTDNATGEVQHKHFIYAEGKLIALNTQTQEANKALKDKQVRYLHYDALNSVDMITDGYGNIVEKRSYDVWGKTRKVVWQESSPTSLALAAITNRGYTGHEQIEEVGLVHMNGRVYDQELGRFISADPIIQAPFVTNSFNRYSYVWNNPLKYVDPTGFELSQEEIDNIGGNPFGLENNYNDDRYDWTEGNKKDDNGSKHNISSEKLYENNEGEWVNGTAEGVIEEFQRIETIAGRVMYECYGGNCGLYENTDVEGIYDNYIRKVYISGGRLVKKHVTVKVGIGSGVKLKYRVSGFNAEFGANISIKSVLSDDLSKQGIDVEVQGPSLEVSLNGKGIKGTLGKTIDHYHPSNPNNNTQTNQVAKFENTLFGNGEGLSTDGESLGLSIGHGIMVDIEIKW
ncbi:RHS repeat-associated core domain-containing protein [Aliivibrio kagoshimensis]|uniref:RHS repeat-associated core domain-containing protein n=1 Tax=Aliivibrio kagoshimensis TaxID=2910230 RepID=UPI003D0D13BB